MGGVQMNYAVECSKANPGQTPVYRSPLFKDKLLDCPNKELNTMKKIILNSAKLYKDKECLGTIIRKEKLQPNQKQNQHPTIKFNTYGEMLSIGADIGSGIIHENLASYDEKNKLSFVGIFSKNRAEWTLIDVGCLLYKIVIIPIYDTLGDENITYVLQQTGLTTCFANDSSVEAIIQTHDIVKIKTVVILDAISFSNIQKLSKRGIKIIKFSELMKIGSQNKIDYNDVKYQIKPQDCLTFSYTSGTTGAPKGAMLSHRNLTSFCIGCQESKDIHFNKDDVIVSYLPLAHVLERELLYASLYIGAKIIYYSGDIKKIKEDLQLAKPTVFVSVPRLFNRLHESIQEKFDKIEGWTKTGLDHALAVKLKHLQNSGRVHHTVYDMIFFQKTKQILGGNVRLMISGSAPMLPEAHNFLRVVMCCPLVEGYGSTESTGGCICTSTIDPQTQHIGGPSNVEYKLVDIPEMDYTSKDVNENQMVCPRGQIWLRGPCVFIGYYKNDKETKEVVNQEGWLKTGDVGVISPGSKSLKIIDRKKNLFKLQQGQYVAPEKIQAIYLKSFNITQAFLTGDSSQMFSVIIVTPNKKHLLEMAKFHGIQGNIQQLCKNKVIRIQMLQKLNEIGKKAGLHGFQQPKNIYLQPEGFLAREIVTSTMKLQRHQGRKIYGKIITEMYAEGMLPSKKEKT